MAVVTNGKPAANAGTATIETALAQIRRGGFVAVMDNEDRENEGDLIMAAQFATEERVAFMLRHSTGIICVPALPERLQQLQMPLMVEDNTETHKCKFTVSTDLKAGNTTGVSAADRARTIRALADPATTADAFNRPGHIFPLIAQRGGVLVRAGHTEAAVDLSRLAGLEPVGYICEMNDQDGRMMRRPQLEQFSQQFDVPLITISDLIRYRARVETLVERAAAKPTPVATPLGVFQRHEYRSLVHDDGQAYAALVLGSVANQDEVVVALVEDGVTQAVRAQWAMQHIAQRGAGVLIHVDAAHKLLQISGELMARQSILAVGLQIAKDLGARSVRLLATADEQQGHFDTSGFGVDVAGFDTLEVPTA